MDINEAHAVLVTALADLDAAATAKGMARKVYISITTEYTALSSGGEIPNLFSHAKPMAEMFAKAHEAIAALHDPHAYDAELSAPLFLLSEQPIAQAAE